MSIVWLIGAEGIGKTYIGGEIAYELGLVYIQLDDFRSKAWAILQAHGVLESTEFHLCSSYEDARTLALMNVDSYIKLYALLGQQMINALQNNLSDEHKEHVLVESTAKYLAVIPQYGLRIRAFVSHQQHINNLRKKCALNLHDATILATFHQTIEKKALSNYPVSVHIHLKDLASKLKSFLV